MKIKLIRKILIGIFFVSTIITSIFVTYKIVQHNNDEVETKTLVGNYEPIKINQNDVHKVISLKDNKKIFDLKNAEYYLVNKTLRLYPELASSNFSFSYDNKDYPQQLELAIKGLKDLKWIYSII